MDNPATDLLHQDQRVARLKMREKGLHRKDQQAFDQRNQENLGGLKTRLIQTKDIVKSLAERGRFINLGILDLEVQKTRSPWLCMCFWVRRKRGSMVHRITDRVTMKTFAQNSYSCEPPEGEYLSAPL